MTGLLLKSCSQGLITSLAHSTYYTALLKALNVLLTEVPIRGICSLYSVLQNGEDLFSSDLYACCDWKSGGNVLLRCRGMAITWGMSQNWIEHDYVWSTIFAG